MIQLRVSGLRRYAVGILMVFCAFGPVPTSADNYVDRGIAKLSKGDVDGAFADFTKAIQLDPHHASEAYSNRGNLKRDKGDLDGAIADFNTAIQLKPDFAAAYNGRGDVKKAKGDLDGALADYNKAIELQTTNLFVPYLGRGDVKKARGDLDGAIADYDTFIRLKPDYADAYNNRGLAKKAKGDLDGAIADYDAAIQLNRDFAAAYNNRGIARMLKGDVDGAYADSSTAIQLKPDYADAYTNRDNAMKATVRSIGVFAAVIIVAVVISVILFLGIRRRIVQRRLELNRINIETNPQAEPSVRRLLLRIGIGLCVVACLADAGLLLRREMRPGPYDSMVDALHSGMSSEDVVKALGQPYIHGWSDLTYRKDGTNQLLGIIIDNGVINEWVIFVPQSHPDRSTALSLKSDAGFVNYEVKQHHLYR